MDDENKKHHDRLRLWFETKQKTWTSSEQIGPGIYVYRDVISEDIDTINTIENVIKNSNGKFSWKPALVGYNESMPEYRDCCDFKYKTMTDIIPLETENDYLLDSMYQKTYERQLNAVKDYCEIFKIGELRYWEATNFVKYGPGHHFQDHHDHGFSYNCTVSLVAYPNDDYEGGELYFSLQDLLVKPKAGDLYIFPSNYMYPHRAMPVISGTKYSLVTMLDYSDKYHRPEFYREIDS